VLSAIKPYMNILSKIITIVLLITHLGCHYLDNQANQSSNGIDSKNTNDSFVIEYHKNGKVSSKAKYFKGKFVDTVSFYHSNGNLNWQSFYDSTGKSQGVFKVYDENGGLNQEGLNVNGKMHGVWKKFYPDGKVSVIEHYAMGYRDSVWTYYTPTGDVAKLEYYLNDSLVSIKQR
jgi:antitoxin component YwqK of YwqJK toxin-antitoxin module